MEAMLDFTRPHVLRDEGEYAAAQARVDELLRLELDAGSAEWEELRFLSVLIEEFEGEHYPIESASPREVMDFLLEQQGMTRADLAEIMGGRSRVSEFFSGKRDLSIRQVRALSSLFHVPADLLIGTRSSDDAAGRAAGAD